MKLKKVILNNFRAYNAETKITLHDLTTLVGKNDAGKSTVLEALEIFFNHDKVKIQSNDIPISSTSRLARIGCVFSGAPDNPLILDNAAETTLKDEYLLNEEGDLEIHKVYDLSGARPSESIFAIAYHPAEEKVKDLILLNNKDLKDRATELGIDLTKVDKRKNPALRSTIWKSQANLTCNSQQIPLDEQDAKKIWKELEKYLPIYALFQSDRPSKDEDPEAQDPMKIAVQEALREISEQLKEIQETVMQRVRDVAKLTVEKLKDISPELAKEVLLPDFKADPKWEQAFKMGLSTNKGVPLNKRGSGVRRLILLSFFRATAEEKQNRRSAPSVIYAIEEPETSQHPSQQKLLAEAFEELADNQSQVLITTHNPAFAGLMPTEGIRHVTTVDGHVTVTSGDGALKSSSDELGVLPSHQVKLLICVEGKHDISFLTHISKVLNQHDETIPNLEALESQGRVAFCPLGGSNLSDWVNQHYFQPLNLPEAHLYDKGTENPPKYQRNADTVNMRTDGSFASLTTKREMENYLHQEAIRQAMNIDIQVDDHCSIPERAAEALHNGALGAGTTWSLLAEEKKKTKISNVKRRLNNEAAERMTLDHLRNRDTTNDLEEWLKKVGNFLL